MSESARTAAGVTRVRGRPLRQILFGWVLRNARARVRDRENLRFERTRLFGRVRRIFVELGRRLAAEGVSFRQLHEEARYGVARQLLEDTRMAANRVADRLGYASASAFTRAFQRWSGMGPAQWRAQASRRRRKRSRGGA